MTRDEKLEDWCWVFLVTSVAFWVMWMHTSLQLRECRSDRAQPTCTREAPATDRGGSDWAVEQRGY